MLLTKKLESNKLWFFCILYFMHKANVYFLYIINM